jgi:uncharacterized protein
MALQLTGTWEQALLAATTRTAAQVGGPGYLGRTALQKILYFLQISDVPMKYRFDLYHYGPFCDLISRDVEWLLADGVLKDGSLNPAKYSNYRASDEATELMEKHRRSLDMYQKTIDTVVKALLPLQPENLEMMATLDYLYRQLLAGGGEGPWKERVIDRFMQVKKDKFSRQDVSSSYDALVRAHLIGQ